MSQPYTTTNILKVLIEKEKKITNKKQYEIVEEIARYCGVTSTSIKRIWEGKQQPSLPLAFKIAKFFDINIEQLFSFIDSNVTVTLCKIKGCNGTLSANGLCQRHYMEEYTTR
ncbi:DNA binding protein [Bacillus phage vB_BceH_LY2]|nr:DNA binding protein [Bacillus phage vB_BceH_LY2]